MSRSTKLAALALMGLVGLSACRQESDVVRFELDGKIFVFNIRLATATYLVNIKRTGQDREGLSAVTSFEDPAGGPAIVVTEKIWPNTTRTTINSPPVRCIVRDRPYQVAIRITDQTGAILQQIDTSVTSSQDQTDLPDRPLVVGPLYTPNPDKSPVAPTICP